MAVKETIAFLGDSGAVSTELMRKLALHGYRLLLISEDAGRLEKVSQELDLQDSQADVEILECAKDGCWEADIIAFVDSNRIGTEIVKRVREVSTQKIVLCVETMEKPERGFSKVQLGCLKEDFPFSKIVYTKVDTTQMIVQVQGEQQEAVETVSRLLETSGFEVSPIAINQ